MFWTYRKTVYLFSYYNYYVHTTKKFYNCSVLYDCICITRDIRDLAHPNHFELCLCLSPFLSHRWHGRGRWRGPGPNRGVSVFVLQPPSVVPLEVDLEHLKVLVFGHPDLADLHDLDRDERGWNNLVTSLRPPRPREKGTTHT